MRFGAGVWCAVVLGCILGWAVPQASGQAASVPREQIEDAIREGCEVIIGTQRADGALVLEPRFFRPARSYVFEAGETALGVLALQHALPHLKGEHATRARQALTKGLAFITQQKPEPMTYSAGTVISALHKDNPETHRKLIGQYAEMLVISQQQEGPNAGYWGYYLRLLPKQRARAEARGEKIPSLGTADHSNTQFAVLGLLYAQLSGFQIPKNTWRLLRKHYIDAQYPDGGWSYRTKHTKGSYANMTLASTISLAICEEMLLATTRHQCKPPPESRPVERGLQWVGQNLKYDDLETYGFYATERLGILSGLSEFGGKPWFDEGARRLVTNRRWPARWTGRRVGAAFAVLFLSRGLEPIIFNKLKRTGDWNNHLHDVKHLVEYISDRFQRPKQWRIVTLDAPVDYLLRVPILWISGHRALGFTDTEKAKLKAYVEQGGTLLGEACCSKPAFNASFRALVKELWPEGELRPLPKTHEIYRTPRPLAAYKPQVLGLAVNANQGRLAVLYLPYGISCRWERGGTRAKPAFDVGANIFFYVDKLASRPTPAGG